jgi:hypothetical protein
VSSLKAFRGLGPSFLGRRFLILGLLADVFGKDGLRRLYRSDPLTRNGPDLLGLIEPFWLLLPGWHKVALCYANE